MIPGQAFLSYIFFDPFIPLISKALKSPAKIKAMFYEGHILYLYRGSPVPVCSETSYLLKPE